MDQVQLVNLYNYLIQSTEHISNVTIYKDDLMKFILNTLLVADKKRLSYALDIRIKELREFLMNTLLQLPEFALFTLDDGPTDEPDYDPNYKYNGSMFIILKENENYIIDMFNSYNQQYDVFIATGVILDYDYIGQDWNQPKDKFFITYYANTFDLYSVAVPLEHYTNIRDKIITRLASYNDTFNKIGYNITASITLLFYPLNGAAAVRTRLT